MNPVRDHYEDDGSPVEGQAAGLLESSSGSTTACIHVAGHGRFDAESKDPLRNGIVISADEILGPVQFRQRLVAPDLVFLNCCHIGRIDPQSDTAEDRSNYAHLAASLALELLRSGVTAVVAAGWAVNDRQASEFASRFYRCMLSGESFGEAVKEPRTAAFDGRTNTWAAYQCYGDPDFQLRTVRPHGRYLRTVHSPRHLINELKAVEKRAGDAVYSEHTVEVVESIRLLQAEAEQRFANNAEVWLALAQAYAEAGAFDARSRPTGTRSRRTPRPSAACARSTPTGSSPTSRLEWRPQREQEAGPVRLRSRRGRCDRGRGRLVRARGEALGDDLPHSTSRRSGTRSGAASSRSGRAPSPATPSATSCDARWTRIARP